MKGAKALLDDPTDGWKADLPLPQIPSTGSLLPIGRPPNFADEKYLELSTARPMNRTILLFFSLVVLVTALLSLIYFFFVRLIGADAGILILPAFMTVVSIGSGIGGIGMLRASICPPRDEPIRFNRKRGKVYLYRFHRGGPISRKGWGVCPTVFNWEDLRAESWSRMVPSPSGVPIFAWGVDVAVVAPDTHHVVDRFQLAGSDADGEHMWAMARAFMNQGLEALPQYPNPPRDWNNDMPPYHLALRLAPKVQWPADIDLESRTAP